MATIGDIFSSSTDKLSGVSKGLPGALGGQAQGAASNPNLMGFLGSTLGGIPGQLGTMYAGQLRKAGEERTRASGIVEGQLSNLNAFYNSEYYKDFLDTAEARSAQSQLQTQLRDMLKAYESNSISTGATPEARIAAKTQGQQRYSEGLNQILGLATQNKTGIRRDYMANANFLNSQLMDIYNRKAMSHEQVAQNVANTGGSLLEIGAGFLKF